MCLESGRKNITDTSAYISSGRYFYTTYKEFESGRPSITDCVGVEFESGRRDSTTYFISHIQNLYVNPVNQDVSNLPQLQTQFEINGEEAGGTSGGSLQYDLTTEEERPDPWSFNFVTKASGHSLATLTGNSIGSDLNLFAPKIIPSFSINGTELSDYLTKLDIKMTFGGLASYNATFKQTEDFMDLVNAICKYPSDLNNLYQGLNTYDSLVTYHKYDTSRIIEIGLELIQSDGHSQVWKSPPFAPGTTSFDGYDLSWAGQDIITIFEQENQRLTDIIADDNTQNHSAYALMKEIFSLKEYEKYRLEFPDFRARQLRRQNDRPLSWMDALALAIWQAQRTWDGHTLVYKTMDNPDNGTPKFKLVDGINISREDVTIEFLDDWKNHFTISRKNIHDSNVKTEECPPSTRCPGRTISVTIDPPATPVVIQTQYYGDCHIQDYNFFSAEGTSLTPGNGNPGIYTGPIPAALVLATCVPHIAGGVNYFVGSGGGQGIANPAALAVNMVGYKLTIKSGNETYASADADFNFEVTDPDTTDLWGDRREYQNIDSEIISNAADAQQAINSILKENIRKIFKAIVKFPTGFINPFIYPGDVISMTDYLTNQDDINWNVEAVSISWDGKQWTQELELTRGILSN